MKSSNIITGVIADCTVKTLPMIVALTFYYDTIARIEKPIKLW